MDIKTYIAQISPKIWLKKFLVIFLGVIGIFLLAAVLIAFLRLSQKGFSLKILHDAFSFAGKIFFDPFYLGEVYWDWAKSLKILWLQNKLSGAHFVPMILPLFLLSLIIWKGRAVYKKFKSQIETIDFSNPQKLINKDFLNGKYCVLGVSDDMLLQMPDNKSLLALGNDSGGKTSCVCIPTILKADNSCIVAVSSQNELAEYTSGYRASLGPVFYFNWGLCDAPLKNEYYPRWNPLSNKEMPPKGKARDDYLKGLAKYFIFYNDKAETLSDDYWPQLAGRALFGLLSFFVAKIEHAAANDYFLGVLLDKDRLSKEDKRLLLSYYVIMNKDYAAPAIEALEKNTLSKDTYLPIGSWEGVPQAWQGKELNLSMFADWLLQCFLLVKAQEKEVVDVWKIVLEYCSQEAEFFGYDNTVTEILQQLFYLSQKQRSVIFPMLFNPLSLFRNSSVRERTSTSDFSIADLRSTYDDPVTTVYSISGDKNINFINKLFVDMLLYYHMASSSKKGERPLQFIFDNAEQQPEYKSLSRAMHEADARNIGLVLTANSLANLQLKYSQTTLENIINKTQYKILLSENISNAASELQKMATGGIVASVQKDSSLVPQIKDSAYYRKVANRLLAAKNLSWVHGDEILFLPNVYKMPFKIRSAFFLAFDGLKRKATFDAAYFADNDLLHLRNIQDMDTPDLLEVLRSSGCKLENLEDIDIYLENRYEAAVETIEQVADKESVLADDISTRWQNQKMFSENEDNDWWLSEDAFDFSDVKENANPFRK